MYLYLFIYVALSVFSKHLYIIFTHERPLIIIFLNSPVVIIYIRKITALHQRQQYKFRYKFYILTY